FYRRPAHKRRRTMWFPSHFSRGQAHSWRARPARRKPSSPRLCVEALEDRTVPSFLAPVASPAASPPVSVAVADFNTDAIPDLLTNDGGTSVLLGKGDGTFQAPKNSGIGGSAHAIGDFNGDGKLDVVTGGGDLLVVLLGNGDGSFRSAGSFSL